MKGQELQEVINNSGLKIDDVIKKSGIPRRTFFNLYKKDTVETHYLKKIKSAGVSVPISADDSASAGSSPSPQLNEKILKALLRAWEVIESDHETFRNIIDRGVEEGWVVVPKKSTQVKH